MLNDSNSSLKPLDLHYVACIILMQLNCQSYDKLFIISNSITIPSKTQCYWLRGPHTLSWSLDLWSSLINMFDWYKMSRLFTNTLSSSPRNYGLQVCWHCCEVARQRVETPLMEATASLTPFLCSNLTHMHSMTIEWSCTNLTHLF